MRYPQVGLARVVQLMRVFKSWCLFNYPVYCPCRAHDVVVTDELTHKLLLAISVRADLANAANVTNTAYACAFEVKVAARISCSARLLHIEVTLSADATQVAQVVSLLSLITL